MNDRQKTFVTIFPNYRDFHFFKDPGQIPFRLSGMGYSSSIVLYYDGSPLSETSKHLNIIKINDGYFSRKFNAGILFYLARHSRDIDVLNLFHFTWTSLLFAATYKLFNRKGFVYLKMDSSRYSGVYPWEAIFDRNIAVEKTNEYNSTIKGRLKRFIIKKLLAGKIDLWSVEDDYTRDNYTSRFDFMTGRLIRVLNGYPTDIITSMKVREYEEKENIILTAGRLGTFQKGTEFLLEGFSQIADKCSFDLHLAGPVEPSFKITIAQYFEQNPGLRERVYFHNELTNKELAFLYNRSKILCMPSRFEGMAIVFSEAMYFRMATVTTKYVSPAGIIDEHKMGIVLDEFSGESIAGGLLFLTENEEKTREYAENAHSFAENNLDWGKIAADLDRELTERLKVRDEELS